MKVPAQWPTATSIYDSGCVCMCMCVFALSNQSLNSSPPSPVPPLRHRPSLPLRRRRRHISPPDRMTAHLWPIVTPDAQSPGRPVEVAINPATRRTPGPLGYPTLTEPLSFSPLIPHPRVPSATLHSLNYSSVYVRCQAKQKNRIKCAGKKYGGESQRGVRTLIEWVCDTHAEIAQLLQHCAVLVCVFCNRSTTVKTQVQQRTTNHNKQIMHASKLGELFSTVIFLLLAIFNFIISFPPKFWHTLFICLYLVIILTESGCLPATSHIHFPQWFPHR